jgi:hypothetical protein
MVLIEKSTASTRPTLLLSLHKNISASGAAERGFGNRRPDRDRQLNLAGRIVLAQPRTGVHEVSDLQSSSFDAPSKTDNPHSMDELRMKSLEPEFQVQFRVDWIGIQASGSQTVNTH